MITVREINNLNDLKSFYEESTESLHIVKIGAPWCGPCRMMSDTLRNLDNNKLNGALIAEVNIEEDESDSIVSEYDVRNIPVTLFIKNGNLLNKTAGVLNANAIYEKIEEFK